MSVSAGESRQDTHTVHAVCYHQSIEHVEQTPRSIMFVVNQLLGVSTTPNSLGISREQHLHLQLPIAYAKAPSPVPKS